MYCYYCVPFQIKIQRGVQSPLLPRYMPTSWRCQGDEERKLPVRPPEWQKPHYHSRPDRYTNSMQIHQPSTQFNQGALERSSIWIWLWALAAVALVWRTGIKGILTSVILLKGMYQRCCTGSVHGFSSVSMYCLMGIFCYFLSPHFYNSVHEKMYLFPCLHLKKLSVPSALFDYFHIFWMASRIYLLNLFLSI